MVDLATLPPRPPLPPGGPADHASRRPAGRRAQPEAPGRSAAPFGRRVHPCGARSPAAGPSPTGAAHAHSLASIATLCGEIGTVGALWILLALLGFLPTVGGTNPVRFESDSILGMRILSEPLVAHNWTVPCVSAGHVHECDRPGSAARGGTHDFPLQNHDRDTRPRPYQHRERRQGGRFEADPKTC